MRCCLPHVFGQPYCDESRNRDADAKGDSPCQRRSPCDFLVTRSLWGRSAADPTPNGSHNPLRNHHRNRGGASTDSAPDHLLLFLVHCWHRRPTG